MTHVLHLTRDHPPAHCGGITTAVAGLVGASETLGVVPRVVSFERARPRGAEVPLGDDRGPRVERITPSYEVGDVLRRLAVAFDIVHLHEPLLVDIAAAVVERDGAGLVFSVHVDPSWAMRAHRLQQPTRTAAAHVRALEEANVVVVPSAAAAHGMAARRAGLAPRLRVVGHGIAPVAEPVSGGPLRAAAMVYAGRFDAAKGTADFFAAAAQVLARMPGTRAIVAGGLPANRRAERRWLRRAVADWPEALLERFEFVGWLDRCALTDLFLRAGVVAVPSHWETFGMVAREAMLCGAPVVATSAGGLEGLLVDRVTGRVVPAGDVEALAAAMAELLERPHAARELGRAGLAAALAADWGVPIEAWRAVYRTATGAG